VCLHRYCAFMVPALALACSLRAIINGGDNDCTGCIGGALFGAVYGFAGVPACHMKLEFNARLRRAGTALLALAPPVVEEVFVPVLAPAPSAKAGIAKTPPEEKTVVVSLKQPKKSSACVIC
jgi:hypothetical protein